MNAPLISVIIPVYNVEPYIGQCVDSVLRQSFTDYELILVDDGSIDGCAAICDGYAERDGRVKVIHKENGGLSSARNAGLSAAAGDYLLFIDGDDYIAENSLRRIAGALRKDGGPDVLFLNALMVFEDGSAKPYGYGFQSSNFTGKSREEVLTRLATGGQFHVSACVKAVKRRLVMERGICFWPGVAHEDVDYSIQLYLAASTYGYCAAPYYYYRQGRPGSIMGQKDGRRFEDLLRIIGKWTDLARGERKDQSDWILRFLFHQYYTLVLLYHGIDVELKTKETRAAVDRLYYLLKYADKGKAPFLLAAYRILGLDLTARLLSRIERS